MVPPPRPRGVGNSRTPAGTSGRHDVAEVFCSLASRHHHLVNTFWPEWLDEQLPDGTAVRVSPTEIRVRHRVAVPAHVIEARKMLPKGHTVAR